MEEVLAHVHPGPIVPDVLSRHHEHQSGLIWSGDHEACFTDLQCRRFRCNLFQCYSTALRHIAGVAAYLDFCMGSCARQLWGCTTDRGSLSLSTDLGVVAYTCIAASVDYGCSGRPSCSSWRYMFAQAQHIPDACNTRLDLYRIQLRENDHTYWETQHASHVLSYPSDEYIRWYRGITWVYIGNPANRDTRSVGYQPVGVERRMMEVDDMASVVIQEPPSSPSQMAVFAKKVQTIIRMCMVSIGGTLGLCHRPREHVLDWGAHGVKRGARRQPGHGARGVRPPILPFPGRHEHVDSGHVEVERGEGSGGGQPTIDPFDSPDLGIPSFSLGLTPPFKSLPSGSGILQMPPPPDLGFVPFQSPHPKSFGFSGFRTPPPSDTASSSTPHQHISQASSFDEEERTDETDVLQHLGFGDRVGKKTTRFTPSDWP
ncbi:hypothetical protein M9H77_16577 [Catharanthus roseus]|uniref:Uncharacterized protein n=1 Tax=Catharanthus roseus TaxID=4058 RepID=A0ACC0B255_CATRO|nr:hypothetical protein M9H77_16577 [Catharanthus roseus]